LAEQPKSRKVRADKVLAKNLLTPGAVINPARLMSAKGEEKKSPLHITLTSV